MASGTALGGTRLSDGLAMWRGRSLATRIVTLFLGLLLAVQAASFLAIRASIDRNTRESITRELLVGERVMRRLMAQNGQRLLDGATLLAADYGFRQAIASNDAETIASVLENHGERIGATVTGLLDTQFKLRAEGQNSVHALAGVARRLAQRASAGEKAADVVVLGDTPYQAVLVPVRAPTVIGWVMMAFPLDQRLVDEMGVLSSLEVALTVRTPSLPDARTVVSTLSAAKRSAMEGALSHDLGASANGDAASTLVQDDGEYSLRPVVLSDHDGAAVTAVLMASVDEAVARFRQLQAWLVGLTLMAVAVFALGCVITARRVTEPIRQLAGAAERLGRGDYDTPLEAPENSTGEIGELAHTFERMRASVAGHAQEVRQLAYWDTLTGLPNRAQFRDAVHEAIAAAASQPEGPGKLAVVILNLDRFKHVNAVLGYEFGDAVLRAVAKRLTQHAVRDQDLVARLGGDEFAVLLRDADVALAQSVAQRIADAFEGSLTLADHTVDLGAGIGVACWPQHAADADALIGRAEVAMHAAKKRTEGALMYDASFDNASVQTLSLLTELRRAVERGELRLYLQPKVMLRNGHAVGAEALVRWQHPLRGLVPPMDFIPFAEQTGFIRVLTMWMFEEAARAWSVLADPMAPLVISVNLSTRDLLDQDLPGKLDALLIKYQVPAEGFCLEITESAIMDDPIRAQQTLERLSAVGFKLSIDDFGTGYSSLAYLKRLPVDELKIDKSFVLNMEHDEDDAKIVRSTIDLAHNMGLCVVAEGVENAAVWLMLRDLQCDQAQGYHMGRPMPLDTFVAWRAEWAAQHADTPPAASAAA
ncbi:MAG: hypothetical protein JWP52_1763, partial [Rhizobacter sp.]|nr:hypothetical protein [Rhizobacter sp.]